MSCTQRALAALFGLMTALAANAADYVVLIQSPPAGHFKVHAGADGRIEIDFSYRDNGRGPDTRESFRVDERGASVTHEATGRATFGAEVRESYQRKGSRTLEFAR